jgi:hypothetical protein
MRANKRSACQLCDRDLRIKPVWGKTVNGEFISYQLAVYDITYIIYSLLAFVNWFSEIALEFWKEKPPGNRWF